MKTLMSVIRGMDTITEEVAVDLEESTAEYAKSLEKIANDKKLKAISKSDKATLSKLADMMKNANEEFIEEAVSNLDEMLDGIIAEDYMDEAFESIEEAMDNWTITVDKAVNKLKKGDEQKVKARSAFEAINKAMKLWGDPSLKAAPFNAFKVTKEGLEEERLDPSEYTVGAEKSKKGYRAQITHNAKGFTMYFSSDTFKDEKDAKAQAQAYLDGYVRGGDRAASKDAGKFAKKNDAKLAEEIIAENTGYSSNQYNLSDSLIAAVNSVVTGEAPAVEHELDIQNDTIEAGDDTVIVEGADGGTGDKEEYQKFFKAALKKFGANSPADLDDKKKKEFYDYVDANWEGDDEAASKSKEENMDNFKGKEAKPFKKDKVKKESKDGDDDDKEMKKEKDGKKAEKVVINPKLDESKFKAKYGDRYEAVMAAASAKLAK